MRTELPTLGQILVVRSPRFKDTRAWVREAMRVSDPAMRDNPSSNLFSTWAKFLVAYWYMCTLELH